MTKNFLLPIGFLAIAILAQAQSLTGVWDASVVVNQLTIPFRLEIEARRGEAKATFYNGKDRYTSTKGTFDGKDLKLEFDYYATRLEASFNGQRLEGSYGRGKRIYPFEAAPHQAVSAQQAAPKISGEWEIETSSPKGEKAWRFLVNQTSTITEASILRIDGDAGTLSGSYRDGKFVLSHFSGARPALLEVTPKPDGTLLLKLNAKTEYIARRPEVARAAGLAGPSDAHHFTGVKNSSEPFHFSAPDLNGKLVTEQDPRFKGKVVLINITGSWCPNCHDEAPFLAALYRKYKKQGLEIVALDFEEEEQLSDPVRLRAFIKKHGIEYTVLLAGETSTAKDKLNQADNWNSWPTTFFVGRDGLVKGAHAGFPSNASGHLYDQAKREFEQTVEKLLAENQVTSR